jgi:hypothetical protein
MMFIYSQYIAHAKSSSSFQLDPHLISSRLLMAALINLYNLMNNIFGRLILYFFSIADVAAIEIIEMDLIKTNHG